MADRTLPHLTSAEHRALIAAVLLAARCVQGSPHLRYLVAASLLRQRYAEAVAAIKH